MSSLAERLEKIVNQLERDDKFKFAKWAANVPSSQHPTDDVDDSTQSPTEGDRAAEHEQYMRENVPESPDTKEDIENYADLGPLGDELEGNVDPSLAGQDTPEQPKNKPSDVPTEHPASAEKTANYIKRIKKASLLELFNEANALLKELKKEASFMKQANFFQLNPADQNRVLLASIKKAAEEAADLTAGAVAAENEKLEEDIQNIAMKLEKLSPDETIQAINEAVVEFLNENPDKAEELIDALVQKGIIPEDFIARLQRADEGLQELKQRLKGLSEEEIADVVSTAVVEFLNENPDKAEELLAVLQEAGVDVSDLSKAQQDAANVAESLNQLPLEEAARVVEQAIDEFVEENPDKVEQLVAILKDVGIDITKEETQTGEKKNEDIARVADEVLNALMEGQAGPGPEIANIPPPPASPPPEVKQASDDEITIETINAMRELNITPNDLRKTGAVGTQMANLIEDFINKGKYNVFETKRGSQSGAIRNYMKSYIAELFRRSYK